MTRASDYVRTTKIIKEIDDNREKHLIIHYSCESFYDKENGASKKIASIAIKRLDNGQTDLFSIHKTAEILKINSENISNHFPKIEKRMLKDFFTFVDNNIDKYWIHWNMRDNNFGFKAIEHRYKVLGGTPTLISDDKKIDLSNLISDRYTINYIDHPRMEKLYELNDIQPKDFLTGKQEADAFESKEFNKLSHSTASKVNLFSTILKSLFDNSLKVKSSRLQIFGTSLQGIVLNITSTWWGKILKWAIPVIFGYFLENILGWIGKLFVGNNL